MSSVFKSEADVRKWMKSRFGKRWFRVEPEFGGDDGMPDGLLALNGKLAPIELKKALMMERKYSGDKQEYKVVVRKSQKLISDRMMECGVFPFSLAGVIGKSYLLIGISTVIYRFGWDDISCTRIETPQGIEDYIERCWSAE